MALEVVAFDRQNSISELELDLLLEYKHVGETLYLGSHKLRRARRILATGMGLLEQGRLGERYFTITQAGMDFVQNAATSRERMKSITE